MLGRILFGVTKENLAQIHVFSIHTLIEKDKPCNLSIPFLLMPISAPLALDRMVKLRSANTYLQL